MKSIYALTTWTRTVDLIAKHDGLATALGLWPSHWACYRFAAKLPCKRPTLAACLTRLAALSARNIPGDGEDIAIDASDLPASANGQRYLDNHGPEREPYSDPDASRELRSAAPPVRAAGSTATRSTPLSAPGPGLPLAWQIETARSRMSRSMSAAARRARAPVAPPARDLCDGQGLRQQPGDGRDPRTRLRPISCVSGRAARFRSIRFPRHGPSMESGSTVDVQPVRQRDIRTARSTSTA